jgi:hypothetical protein
LGSSRGGGLLVALFPIIKPDLFCCLCCCLYSRSDPEIDLLGNLVLLYGVQAFRHLYVLAAESRCLQAVDVHSRQQVVVPLDITAHKHGMVGPVAAAAAAAAASAQAGSVNAGQQQQHGVQGLMAAQQHSSSSSRVV